MDKNNPKCKKCSQKFMCEHNERFKGLKPYESCESVLRMIANI